MASRFLYLVRHGDAAEGGRLSDAGEEQARRTGERLKNLPVTQIHRSPLPRAAQTARLIAGWLPGVPVFTVKVAASFAARASADRSANSGFIAVLDAATGDLRALLAELEGAHVLAVG